MEAFKIFIDKNSDKTLIELASLYEEEFNIKLSRMAIHRTLKLINYSSKKKALIRPLSKP